MKDPLLLPPASHPNCRLSTKPCPPPLPCKATKMTLVGTLLLSAAVSVAAAPCDIFAAAGTPCVAAHSTTRSLFSAFSASLYQVSRASDGELKDIPVVAPGGVANSAIQDTFCSSTTCTISRMYVCPPFMDFIVSLRSEPRALSTPHSYPVLTHPPWAHLSAPITVTNLMKL